MAIRCQHSPRLDMIDSADAATRARARGRFITESLARSLAPGMLNDAGRAAIIAGDPAAWALNIDRSGGTYRPDHCGHVIWMARVPTTPSRAREPTTYRCST